MQAVESIKDCWLEVMKKFESDKSGFRAKFKFACVHLFLAAVLVWIDCEIFLILEKQGALFASLDATVVNVGRLVLSPPEQNAHLAPVHENEALALVSHIGAKPTTHDAVPGWQVHLIELSLDDLSNVVENSALGEGERHAVNSMLLHVLVHVGIFHNSVLRVLLVDVPVGLHVLRVRVSLPLLGLVSSRVSCNLRQSLSLSLHFSFNLTINQ